MVNGVENSIYYKDIPQRTPSAELGKDDFLLLLLTQMKYQDPLNPMDSNDYIAQMAQLSTLEQMTNMTHAFNLNRACQLIGKNVLAKAYGLEMGETEYVFGKVDGFSVMGSEIILVVGEKQIRIEDVLEVSEATEG
ncbi:MAG: flagellar hook capping protein [Clostridiales bacterium]|jgi:flagellar basal-body rod modification protein FlgD|nr:flagellar hook capping protein [Clostridiales bacterium]